MLRNSTVKPVATGRAARYCHVEEAVHGADEHCRRATGRRPCRKTRGLRASRKNRVRLFVLRSFKSRRAPVRRVYGYRTNSCYCTRTGSERLKVESRCRLFNRTDSALNISTVSSVRLHVLISSL